MTRALLFDLDGTLIDSRKDLAASANAALAAVGLPPRPEDVILGFVGGGSRRLIERAVGAEHIELAPRALEAFFAHYGEHLVDATVPYPGIAELIRELPRPCAVLTNKNGGFAREICRRLELSPHLDAIWGADDAPTHKPDPRGALLLCAKLGARPEDSVLVGDTRIDGETARQAGLRFIGVTWGFGTRAELSAFLGAPLADDAAALRHLLLE